MNISLLPMINEMATALSFNPNSHLYVTFSKSPRLYNQVPDNPIGSLASEFYFNKISGEPTPTILEQTADEDQFVFKLYAPKYKTSEIDVSLDPEFGDVSVSMKRKDCEPIFFKLTYLYDYDTEKVKCSFKEEILTIKIPRKESSKPRSVIIE